MRVSTEGAARRAALVLSRHVALSCEQGHGWKVLVQQP